jgi:hypothetical protein
MMYHCLLQSKKNEIEKTAFKGTGFGDMYVHHIIRLAAGYKTGKKCLNRSVCLVSRVTKLG